MKSFLKDPTPLLNTHLHSHILTELPRSPLMFMSLELLTHWTLYSPPPPPPLPSVFPPSFLLSSRPMTLPHGKLVPPEVYLNPTQKFTLPRPYLNRALPPLLRQALLSISKANSPRVTGGNVYSRKEQRANERGGATPSCNPSPVFPAGTPYCLLRD